MSKLFIPKRPRCCGQTARPFMTRIADHSFIQGFRCTKCGEGPLPYAVPGMAEYMASLDAIAEAGSIEDDLRWQYLEDMRALRADTVVSTRDAVNSQRLTE